MAKGTVWSKLVIVNIFVTTGTVIEFNSFEFLEFLPVFASNLVTGNANNFLVFTDKLKSGIDVIKF